MSKQRGIVFETFNARGTLINSTFRWAADFDTEYDETKHGVRNVARFTDEVPVYWIEGEVKWNGKWRNYKSKARTNSLELSDHIIALGKTFGASVRNLHIYNQSMNPDAIGNLVKIVDNRAFDEVVYAWAKAFAQA